MTMALPLAFDLDLLRSFVIIAEEKSFTRAAERVGRTQSAITLQMQKLEGVLGQAVLIRGKGGHVELSPFGQTLLGRAKELLALNDDVMGTLKAKPTQVSIRLGISDELAERFLSSILKGFAGVEPTGQVHVTTASSCELAQQLQNGGLDLVLLETDLAPRQWPAEEIWSCNLRWATSEEHQQHINNPLPIMVGLQVCPFRPAWLTECVWRGMAVRALERANRNYHIVATSISTAGLLAGVAAGLAVTATLEGSKLPQGIRLVEPHEGLPELPVIKFLMLRGRNAPAHLTNVLAEQTLRAFNS